MFAIKCDVHPWMRSYIGVFSHPFFAVTGSDGKFTIANLPAGTYEIEAWHEKLGTQKATVTVGASDTKRPASSSLRRRSQHERKVHMGLKRRAHHAPRRRLTTRTTSSWASGGSTSSPSTHETIGVQSASRGSCSAVRLQPGGPDRWQLAYRVARAAAAREAAGGPTCRAASPSSGSAPPG